MPPRPSVAARRFATRRRLPDVPRVLRTRRAFRIYTACGIVATIATLIHANGVRNAWGVKRAVVEMARPVARGATIRRQDVRLVLRPSALVHDGASTSIDEVVGRRASEALYQGDTGIVARLRSARSEASSLLDNDQRGVAIARAPGIPAVKVGDRVSVIDSNPDSDGSSGPTAMIDGEVIEVNDDVVVVGVDADDVVAVVRAIQQATVALIYRP